MKAKNTTQSYREVARHLDDLVQAMEVIVTQYNEANCTFAEALGEQKLSHELDKDGRFHYLPKVFNKSNKLLGRLMEQLKASKAEYQVLQLLEPTHLN